MDFRSLDGANPLSEQFRREAAQNVMQNIASLRSQKDLKSPSGDDEPLLEDRVTLARPEKTRTSAEASPDPKDRSDTSRASSKDAGGDARVEGRGEGVRGRDGSSSRGSGAPSCASAGSSTPESQALLSAAAGGGLLEDKDPALRKRKEEEARRLARAGVPEEILKASRDIVQGQVHPVRGPKASLREMKDIPEVASLETRPAEFAPEMDICVRHVPLVQEEPDPQGPVTE